MPRVSRISCTCPSSPKVPCNEIKARSVPSGTAKLASATMTSSPSYPASRRASAAAAPVLSETSRSAEGPPFNTAMRWGLSLILIFPPQDNDLGMEVDLPRFAGAALDQGDELQHVLGRRPAVVHDEISMDFRNPGRADGKILQAQLVDQFAGGDRPRILEDATGARRGGLRGPPLARVGFQLFVDLLL